MKNKVFLGGTVNGSKWRNKLIPKLKIDYFNPVVKNWNEKAYRKELYERKICNYCLYVLTPKMHGVYSVAEVVDDSNKRPNKTLLCILEKDGNNKFTDHQVKSINKVADMVRKNGGMVFQNLDQVARFLNDKNGSYWFTEFMDMLDVRP